MRCVDTDAARWRFKLQDKIHYPKIEPRMPSQSPLPQSVLGALRFVVFLQCIGVAGMYWFSEFEIESDIYGSLYFDFSWPETLAQRIDDYGSLACLFAGFVIIAPASRWDRFRVKQLQRFAAGFVAAWMFTLAATHMIRGGNFAELSLGEHAVRYAAPLVLMIFLGATDRIGTAHLRTGILILMVAASATFAVHGYKAMQLHGQFADLILLTDANWAGFEIEQSTVQQILWGIGAVDLVVAALLWVPQFGIPRIPAAAIYMVIWGIVTAASRMTALGANAWPDTLIRSANWGCPLAVALYLLHTKTKPPATVQ